MPDDIIHTDNTYNYLDYLDDARRYLEASSTEKLVRLFDEYRRKIHFSLAFGSVRSGYWATLITTTYNVMLTRLGSHEEIESAILMIFMKG